MKTSWLQPNLKSSPAMQVKAINNQDSPSRLDPHISLVQPAAKLCTLMNIEFLNTIRLIDLIEFNTRHCMICMDICLQTQQFLSYPPTLQTIINKTTALGNPHRHGVAGAELLEIAKTTRHTGRT